MLLIGNVDLNDRTKYRWSEPDDGENWENADWPRRFAGVDTLGISRSNKVNDVLTFNIICFGDDQADGQGAVDNYKAIRAECEQARLFEVTRKREGSTKTVKRAIPGQTDPDIYTIKKYTLHRTNLALGAIGQVHCQLVLTVVEGLVDQNPTPVPARWRWLAPPMHVALGAVERSEAPVAWAWTAPEMSVFQGEPPPIVPEIAIWTWTAPPAVVTGPTPMLLADYDMEALGLADSDPVITWTDESGNGHDLGGPGGHRAVKLSSGGPHDLAFARFSGNEIARSVDTDVAPVGNDERVIFVVFRCTDFFPPAMNIVSYGPEFVTNGIFSMGTEGGTNAVKAYFWGTEGTPKDIGDLQVWNVAALQVNAAGNPKWWLNGVPQTADFGQFPVTGVDIFNIGGRTGNDGDFVGDIARVRVFSGMLDAEIEAQFSYLMGRYL